MSSLNFLLQKNAGMESESWKSLRKKNFIRNAHFWMNKMKIEIIGQNGEKHIIVGTYAERIFMNASKTGIALLSYIREYTSFRDAREINVHGEPSRSSSNAEYENEITGIIIHFRNIPMIGRESIVIKGRECARILKESSALNMTPEEYLSSEFSPFISVRKIEILKV